MAEQIFIIEDGMLTKYEADDYVEVVYIPDSVTTIEADAFMDCTLEEIEIPDSVTTIETWAFSGRENLQSITIPESVTSIGPGQSATVSFSSFRTGIRFRSDVPSSYTENQAVKPNGTQKTITGVSTNTLPNFGRSKLTVGNWKENHNGRS